VAHDRPAGRAERAVLENAERQSLLGLLVHSVIAANLADDGVARRVAGLTGEVEVAAGDMTITLDFRDGRVAVRPGPAQAPRARVRGDMAALLGVVLGGGLVGPFLAGAIRIGGNPFVLLKLLPLLKKPAPAAAPARDGGDDPHG
jgi:hypothetical protein